MADDKDRFARSNFLRATADASFIPPAWEEESEDSAVYTDALEKALMLARNIAQARGQFDLADVISALKFAVEYDDVDLLLNSKSNTTMLGHALAYQGPNPERRARLDVVRAIAAEFDEEPESESFPFVIDNCERHLRSWADAAPAENWKARALAECQRVYERDPKTRKGESVPRDRRVGREPFDYARAVLRGWGLSGPQADNAVKPLTRKQDP